MGRGKLRDPKATEGQRIKTPSDGGGSTQQSRVRLSFEFFNADCANACTLEDLRDLTAKLARLTSNAWQAVCNAPKNGLGFEQMPRARLKFSVPSSLAEDTTFIVFRFGKAARMIGFRQGTVLQVVWLAPKHDAY